MAITWTIIVLGALLHGMHSDASHNTTVNSNTLTTQTTSTITQPQINTNIPSQQPASTTQSMQPSSNSTPSQSSPAASTQPPVQTPVQSPAQTPVQTPVQTPIQTHSVAPSASSNTTGPSSQAADSSTTQAQPSSTDISLTNAVSTVSTHNPVNSLTTPIPQGLSSSGVTSAVPTQSGQKTTIRDSSTTTVPTTTQSLITHNKSLPPTESSTQTTTSTQPNSVTSNAEKLNTTTPDSTSAISLRHQTSEIPTTAHPITLGSTSGQLGPDDVSTTSISITKTEDMTQRIPDPRKFDMSNATEGDILFEACKALGPNMKGQCSVSYKIEDKKITATFTIDADQLIKKEIYNPPEQKKNINEENTSMQTVPDTMIAILASCGALVLILCCFAAYCTYHRRSYRKNQQHLTEEMQTVENGYHDNPTLEVMEVQPEMQEKKLVLNGEFNDSWIVPIDNLLKEDIPDEEDTHL
ncbi:podocalyxin isoform X2 [Xyrauchen texanus]|uniref:podocalyxin isoform X2 n=1 Tax=Xyrauchen texanus TaxID=154827 RepID=UPI0022423BA9|nr:podocalyxin isoform X2 [Xyrauchen texanus]